MKERELKSHMTVHFIYLKYFYMTRQKEIYNNEMKKNNTNLINVFFLSLSFTFYCRRIHHLSVPLSTHLHLDSYSECSHYKIFWIFLGYESLSDIWFLLATYMDTSWYMFNILVWIIINRVCCSWTFDLNMISA